MELLLGIAVVLFTLVILIEKITALIKQVKSYGSAKLNKGFQATLSVIPIDKKSEDVHQHPHK